LDLSSPTFEPSRSRERPLRVSRILALLTPTALALYATFQGIQQILAPVQVEAIDPSGKVGNIAVLTMICAVTGVLGLSMGGGVTDGTRSRWGRRTPWLVAMAAASAALAIGMGFQRSLTGVAVFYGALWFTLNFFQGALLATVPDRVPEHRRSLASSLIAVASPLGAVVGVNVAALAPLGWGYLALVIPHVATALLFVYFAREGPYLAPKAQALDGSAEVGLLGRALGSLASFASRDFALAFAFRVLMFIGQYSVSNYLLYILQDHIGVANLPQHDAQIASGVVNALRTATTIVAIGGGLWLANRTDRRRIFAQAYVVGMVVAMLAPVFWPNWIGMLIFAAVGGAAIGAYSTIDLTLMARVLPSRHSAGRDLAMLLMAGAAAQFVAPPLGGALIRLYGYDTLFVVAACITLLSGSVTWFFRGVR
jgi:MFS family permease